MEYNSIEENPKVLVLNNQSISFLSEIAKWSQFLAIIGFIGIGFMVILALFAEVILNSFSAAYGGQQALGYGFFTVTYLIAAFLYFFPVLYLFRFSTNLKSSLIAKNDDDLTLALEYLKSHYKFIGILTIVVLGSYLLLIIFSIMGMLAASFL